MKDKRILEMQKSEGKEEGIEINEKWLKRMENKRNVVDGRRIRRVQKNTKTNGKM